MIMYMAVHYLGLVHKIEVTRETAQFVFVQRSYGEQREKKNTPDKQVCRTFDEAKQALITAQELKIENSQNRINYQRGELKRIEQLTQGAD